MTNTELIQGNALPFKEVIKLIDFFPFGNPYRVAYTLLALTGARISEIDNMGPKCLRGDLLIWKTGKNQKGYRRAYMPQWFLNELSFYMENSPHCSNKFFLFAGKTLRDVLNKQIRPILKGDWLKLKDQPPNGMDRQEYVYQLKGLRHSYATLDFYNKFKKWGGTVAVEFTCKAMGHSSYKMTAGHYIGNFEKVEVEKWQGWSIADILKQADQRKMTEFL